MFTTDDTVDWKNFPKTFLCIWVLSAEEAECFNDASRNFFSRAFRSPRHIRRIPRKLLISATISKDRNMPLPIALIAFSGPSDNWADRWTALSGYGYLKTAATGSVAPPNIASAQIGNNLRITFFGQDGVSYRVETSSDLSSWAPLGGPSGSAVGRGQDVSLSYTSTGGTRSYRVLATNQ